MKIEYFNLFLNRDLKDTPEMRALIELVKKPQEQTGKRERIFSNIETVDTNKENNEHRTVDLSVFINQKDRGAYATVKLVAGEEEDNNPF